MESKRTISVVYFLLLSFLVVGQNNVINVNLNEKTYFSKKELNDEDFKAIHTLKGYDSQQDSGIYNPSLNPNSATPDLIYRNKYSHSNPFYTLDYTKVSIGTNWGVGLILYNETSFVDRVYREYLGVKLPQPLEKGAKYIVEFHVMSGEDKGLLGFSQYKLRGVGAYFSNMPIHQENVERIDVKPQCLSDRTLGKAMKSSSWVVMEFVAEDNYQFMTIGNFGKQSDIRDNKNGYNREQLKGLIEDSHSKISYLVIEDIRLTKKKNSAPASSGQSGTGVASSGQSGTGVASSGQSGTGVASSGQSGTGVASSGQSGTGVTSSGQSNSKPPCGQRYELPNLRFKKDSSKVFVNQTKAWKELDIILKDLNTFPEIKILIEGHTESLDQILSRYKTKPTIESITEAMSGLSHERALTAKKYFVDKGVDPSRIEIRALGISSPVNKELTDKAASRNRRIVIEFQCDSQNIEKSVNLYKGDKVSFNNGVNLYGYIDIKSSVLDIASYKDELVIHDYDKGQNVVSVRIDDEPKVYKIKSDDLKNMIVLDRSIPKDSDIQFNIIKQLSKKRVIENDEKPKGLAARNSIFTIKSIHKKNNGSLDIEIEEKEGGNKGWVTNISYFDIDLVGENNLLEQ